MRFKQRAEAVTASGIIGSMCFYKASFDGAVQGKWNFEFEA